MTRSMKTAGVRTLRCMLVAGASAAAMSASAFAQGGTPASDTSPPAADEVLVTGSRIGGGALEAPQPLIQLGGEELINSGEPNIVDYLADIPALQGSFVPEDTTGAGLGDGGLSLLNLRQLGADRTLVLVNGRRHVGASPGTGSVDIDTIPRLLIKNVDIVTGASSAVYGADAVSGVVNFILEDEFEGLKLDVAGASISQGFEGFNYRFSGVAGKSFFDDRLNLYVSAEYEASDEIRQSQLKHRANDAGIFVVDVDPAGNQVDGIIDRRIVSGNLTSISRPTGGIFTLSHDIRQNGITDNLNIPFVACSTTSTTSGNCFIIDPGFSFQFNPVGTGGVGTSVLPNYGTFRSLTGSLRTTVQNGSGDPLTSFQSSQLPDTDALRFQAGGKFEVTPRIQAYFEGKYVKENSTDGFQPAFFDIQFAQNAGNPLTTRQYPNYAVGVVPHIDVSLNQFTVPLFTGANANPLIPADIRTAINNNVRTTFASATCSPSPTTGLCTNPNFFLPTGTTPDQRGQIRVFTTDYGQRPQELTREMYRFVGGFRGDMDKLLFVDNVRWDVGFTYGKVQDRNEQTGTIDVGRLLNSLDVVPDTAGALGAVNAPVCRVRLLALNPLNGIDPNAPDVRNCIPGTFFGAGGMTPTIPYVVTNVISTNTNQQYDAMGFLSGELWDLWGAGPIGFSIGGEWRRELASGTYDYLDSDPRALFANTGSDFPQRGYNVKEGFFEAKIPLLSDVFFAKKLLASGAVRVSDYSSIGFSKTWNAGGVWEVNDELTFRGTYGISVRAPNLDELFSPPSQTFIQITDPCSQPVILGTSNPTIQANRIANCAALGIPNTYNDPNPTSSNPGANSGNPFLLQEKSTSWTASLIWQPSFIPNFSAVIDFFDIDIQDAIAAAGIQTVANLCVDGNTPNIAFCNTFTRDPATFEIIDFVQGAVNFSSLNTRGIDFAFKYHTDLADDWFSESGMVPGRLSWNLRGTYLIRRDDFVNINDPTDGTELDGNFDPRSGLAAGQLYPRVRFLLTTAWKHGKLQLSHDLDLSTGVEIEESQAFAVNTDSGLIPFRKTGTYTQHDLTATYELNDNFSLRGGVVNVFDNESPLRLTYNDFYDIFGRRFFIGASANF